MDSQISEPVLDELENLGHIDPSGSEGTSGTKELSDRDFKIAYARAVKERKEKIRQNKEMVSDLELEVSYWKAQSDLLKFRFEKMDYYLKNLEIEPRYLQAVEEQKAKEAQGLVTEPKPTFD